MIINTQNLDHLFSGYQRVFQDAFGAGPADADQIVMRVQSSTSEETYAWLAAMPGMREWIGERVIQGIVSHGFKLVNRKFESTVSVPRDRIMDDQYGVYSPMFAEMGHAARRHVEELTFGLLASGFTSNCYDGQFFFDTDHPIRDAETGEVQSVSNVQAGSGPAWYLLDVSRAVRPVIWQVREDYTFERMDRLEDAPVFMRDEYIYGVRARVNAGFGLWQLAFGSKATLDAANYKAARAAMMGFTSEGGKKLGIRPGLLVVPPELEEEALQLLNAEHETSGASNVWRGTARLIVTPYAA